jgi:hypothetical protein
MLLSLGIASSRGQYPAKVNTCFNRGEKLEYAVYFHSLLTGNVKAGVFVMEVTTESREVNDRPTYHYIATGQSRGAFHLLYQINDRFESYTDEASLLPLLTLRRINEDDYKRNQDHIFDHKNHKVVYKDNIKGSSRTIDCPAGIHDILSVVYYLRNADASREGDIQNYNVSYMFNDSVYSSKVLVSGPVSIRTGIGKIECIKVRPQVLIGNVFSSKYPLTVWVSNDKNRIPVLVESEILLGSIRVELVKWTGLKNPFTALE